MTLLSSFKYARLLSLVLFLILLISAFGLAVAASPGGEVEGGDPEVWYGLYTDATSYEPGDSIQIFSSSPDVDTVFRLVRLDEDWTEIVRTDPLAVGPQASKVGSFLEYSTVSLSGRTSFTLEGWLHPTLLGGDTVVVAGQIGLTESAAGIVILPDPNDG